MPTVNPFRVDARRSSRQTYVGDCPLHGRGDFHTIRGVCLSCCNTMGYPRPKGSPRNPLGLYVDRSGEIRESP